MNRKILQIAFYSLSVTHSSLGQNSLEKKWDHRFGGTADDLVYAIQETPDSGFIQSGYTYSGIGGDKTQPSWGGTDYWVVKTDAHGILEWEKRFGGSNNEL